MADSNGTATVSKMKQGEDAEEEVNKKLCLFNGLSYDKCANEGSDIRSLEIFFSGFPRMLGLSVFPELRQLTIVGQDIDHIEGLECCPLLQELWVVQCRLTEIFGLQNCQQLEKLYLYENQICEIKNLEFQVNLKVLWLNNNRITTIEGFNTLKSLQELNLADNIIEKIGHSLDLNVNLEILNLSGNRISSFKELTALAHLPSLRELALQDPMSSPNPVCLLCNYATHVLYHNPGLHRLDSYNVSDKQAKDAAESAVMKKTMYYNMRVRSAQRKLEETQFRLLERKKTLMQLPEECIKTLSRTLKSLQRAHPMSEAESGGTSYLEDGLTEKSDSATSSHDPAVEHKVLLKIESLRERLNVWARRMDDIEAWYEQELIQATTQTGYTVQFLLMELESVGNIRLEEGSSTDPWFTYCCNLLLSRFSPSDYKRFHITDIKINRVLRIHNSTLRLRFEDKLQSLLDSEESASVSQNYRCQLDYLFYLADLEKCEKEATLCALEEGFKTTQQRKTFQKEDAVPLSNSLNITEQPRIEYLLQKASECDSKQSADAIPFRHGHVIVCKVFVGNSMPIRDKELLDRVSHLKICSVYRNVDTKPNSPTNDERPSSAKTHPDCVPQQRQWFVFDHDLVLPEYIVYFEYITEDKELIHFVIKDKNSKESFLDEAALNMEPVLKPQPKLLGLDDKILLSVAQANVLSQITVLNLHDNNLSKIKAVSSLRALRHLTISFNKFTNLGDLSHMTNLEFLDASFNHLMTLEGLRGLKHLKELDVSWNELTKAREDSAVLRKHTPVLMKLDTRYNPWNRPETVRLNLLSRLTALTYLDGVLVEEEEAAEAAHMAINQATLLAHSRTKSDRPRSLSLLSTAQLLSHLNPAPWGPGTELEPDWAAKITSLNLDNQRISRICNMNELVNLRWASFNNNAISKLEGLDHCLKLEELFINDNNISSLSGLTELHCLNKLSMDRNQLSSLGASVLGQLPNLTFLSMANNCITSLHGIWKVRSLLELYIESNQISSSRDIYFLKGLANLIILDLYGNPLVTMLENYRIYVVFHLPSLKALDGTAVDLSECESANNMFKGRLTTDAVAEKLGHSNYADITNLSLQSCSIRMVDLSPANLFHNLHSVNLENNNLTSFSGLIHLPNIKVLCLNHNHIESILPVRKTQAHLTKKRILYSKVHSSGYGQQSPSKANRDTRPTSSLEPLMGSLEVLHLSHNGISNMANLQLSRLTNLKALFLQGNEISQVEGLEGLLQLRELVLDRNRIKTLGKNAFIAQNILVELHLAGNRIRELNHLDPLVDLRKLFLDMNKLQDMSELNKLEVLPSLTELSVVGNPVARNSLHRPALVLRLNELQVLDGVLVTLEERTSADEKSFQSCQHSGSAFPTTKINLPELLPLLPHNITLRGILSAGLPNFMRDTQTGNADENQYTDKYKKHNISNVGQISQANVNLRPSRSTGSYLPTLEALSYGNREANDARFKQQDNRFPYGGKHPPM
ncbi:leucine-rich repeat-containing protein 9 [Nematolebias whitei]|uniref:leucine-rich repeat-containing protein 9 n=1 Tax=Nematolebias whitei TaxID=451745 RepID=UPI001898E2E6|nr:leucine-rich repeat-containing protein 9 [Nematolebias whitei]